MSRGPLTESPHRSGFDSSAHFLHLLTSCEGSYTEPAELTIKQSLLINKSFTLILLSNSGLYYSLFNTWHGPELSCLHTLQSPVSHSSTKPIKEESRVMGGVEAGYIYISIYCICIQIQSFKAKLKNFYFWLSLLVLVPISATTQHR